MMVIRPGTLSAAALTLLVAAPAFAEQAAGPRGSPEPVRRPPRSQTLVPAGTEARTAEVDALIEKMVPARSDTPADWIAGPVRLHHRGEPRTLPPCIPPAPCHPAFPPQPADLLGSGGIATCGPRYRGPCHPRLGTHDHAPLPRLHALHDAAFDAFYR